MKVLHITNWYPNVVDPVDAQFIKDQVDALHQYAHSEVMHIQVREGRFQWFSGRRSERERHWLLIAPVKSWFIKEILSGLLLFFFLALEKRKKYNVVNIHIAYPLLTYFHFFRWTAPAPVIVSEHWSAYRSNFNTSSDLKRIRKIFQHNKKFITVSQSLAADIARFSGCSDLQISIVPNVLSDEFRSQAVGPLAANDRYRLFMLGCWQPPKQPLVVLQAIANLPPSKREFFLRVGGYGVFESEIIKTINELQLHDCVKYIGKLSYAAVAAELSATDFFVQPSDYETFSVVCLEALWQGVPVMASKVGGIPEFVNSTNGILVETNSVAHWQAALEALPVPFDRETIQKHARETFSPQAVGERYYGILQSCLHDEQG